MELFTTNERYLNSPIFFGYEMTRDVCSESQDEFFDFLSGQLCNTRSQSRLSRVYWLPTTKALY